jgi:hypothetical protein
MGTTTCHRRKDLNEKTKYVCIYFQFIKFLFFVVWYFKIFFIPSILIFGFCLLFQVLFVI